MPWIRVIHNGVDFPFQQRWLEIEQQLKEIVAEGLTCTDIGGSLEPKDVEVEVKMSKLGDSLHSHYAVMFHIDAHDFPSRKANLRVRGDVIAEGISKILEFKGLKGFVWVKLFPSTFVEF